MRSVSLQKRGFGRYGALTYPFDPRRNDGPGMVGEATEAHEEKGRDSSSSNNNNSNSCSSKKRLDAIWRGTPTFPFDTGKTRRTKVFWWFRFGLLCFCVTDETDTTIFEQGKESTRILL